MTMYRRCMRPFAVLALVGAVLALSACAGTKALYSQAQTPPQYAKAVLLHHNAIGTQIASMVADPGVSEATKSKLRTAYRATVCSKDELTAVKPTAQCVEGPTYQLDKAIIAYESVKNAVNEGNVTNAVNLLLPLVTTLLNVVSSR